jgi:NitT/TauT family transport system permease protein
MTTATHTSSSPSVEFRPGPRRSRGQKKNFALPLISALIGLLIWEAIVRAMAIPSYLLPAPSEICIELYNNWGYLISNLGYTALASIVGFAIALVLGIVLGTVIASFRVVDRILYPWLVISHAVPKVVVAPLMLVWVGFGLKSSIIFVIFFTFFPIIVNTVMGLKSTDPELLQLIRSMRASRFDTLWKIKIPNALPSIFSGIKIAATLAPVGAVIGEFVASNQGLGYVIIQAVGSMSTALAFAAVFLVSIFGLVVWYVAEFIEKKSLPWHASQRVPTQ